MKFQRIYELRVQVDGVGDQPGEFIIIRSPLTIEFSVERNNQADQKSANFKIYNLSEETRARIFHDMNVVYDATDPKGIGVHPETIDGVTMVRKNYPRLVEFFVGYEDDEAGMTLCFTGQAYYSHSTRRGSEFITEIECLDPGINQYITTSAQSLAKTVDKKDIIRSLYVDLIGAEAAQAGYISDSFAGLPSRGRVLFGNTMKLLREITDNNIYFDLGRPIAMKMGETLPGTTIYEINADSGLLNIPTKTGTLVIAKVIFSPEIQIGQGGALNSLETEYNGIYQVYGIRHTGTISGTHDAPTQTEITLFNGAILTGKV